MSSDTGGAWRCSYCHARREYLERYECFLLPPECCGAAMLFMSDEAQHSWERYEEEWRAHQAKVREQLKGG